MDGDLDRAEAKGQIKEKGLRYCLQEEWAEHGRRDGKQSAVCYIPAQPRARGAAQVQVAELVWSCAARNFGDFGDRGRGRGMHSPTAEGLGWAQGSDLGRHRHNHPLERNPAITLTARITDFCLYNYTRLLSAHCLRHRHIRVSILQTQPGDVLCWDNTLHLPLYSIYTPIDSTDVPLYSI